MKNPEIVESNNFDAPVDVPHKREMESFGDISPQQRSGGQEILNMRNRMYDQGRMNNLSPIEKQLVGPGLGVGPHVPAVGGFQQSFRVNPINVGEYRLTTLPGRAGPAADVTGGRSLRSANLHIISLKLPLIYLLEGLRWLDVLKVCLVSFPENEHEKTKRTTNRSETGHRADGLGFSGAKRFVPANAMPQDPTRFKTDRNDEQYMYANHPAPGIHSHHGGIHE